MAASLGKRGQLHCIQLVEDLIFSALKEERKETGEDVPHVLAKLIESQFISVQAVIFMRNGNDHGPAEIDHDPVYCHGFFAPAGS
ncbi:MAG TPA: hypothetical protein PK014_12825 [Thermoanaerobaculia bacterium]|nr:hypothetical protein [Thermoanaerobaculia bacterium]HUM30985.1 hypothetical protein [Thermoanaerobaculia bacterium]HXK69282.1 hypothetical protein [Thermoanaerobaculia bacterium]